MIPFGSTGPKPQEPTQPPPGGYTSLRDRPRAKLVKDTEPVNAPPVDARDPLPDFIIIPGGARGGVRIDRPKIRETW